MIFDIILSKAIDSIFHFRRNQLELTHLVSAAKQIEGLYIIDSNRSANIRFGSDSSIFTILGRWPTVGLNNNLIFHSMSLVS